MDKLFFDNDKYYYHGELFSGVAFEFKEGDLKQATEYQMGEPLKAYSSEFLADTKGQLRIDSDFLEPENEEDYDPFQCYRGELFNGIAYDFESDGTCSGEILYVEGRSDSCVGYYKTGVLESLELIDSNFAQKFYWYEGKAIKQIEVFERDSFHVDFNFSETGGVTALIIEGNYFGRIKSVKDKLKFNVFEEKDFASDLFAGEHLYVSGSEINEDVFANLLANDGLRKTSKLRICRTPLSLVSLGKLVPLENITELYVESEALTLEDLQNFKSQRPDCFVEFNREEVTA